ncbi:unnamed protein product [Brassica oleracea]
MPAIFLLIVTGHSSRVYESNYLAGVNLEDFTFLDFPAPETYGVEHYQEIQEMLGVSVPSEGNGVLTKKLNHNASERDRRKKINSLFSSLRSCLPASDQTVKEAKYSSDGFSELEVHSRAARASEEANTKEGRTLGASIRSKSH